MSDQLQRWRSRAYRNRMDEDKKSVYGARLRAFTREVSSVLITRALILSPLDRLKLIHQTEPICKYINPSDRPKSTLDLIQKININQGFFAFYRGLNALFAKILCNYGIRFVSFGYFEKTFDNTVLASISAAIFNTLLTYPLDVAQGRMQGDMSKKPSLFVAETNISKNNLPNKPNATI